MNTNLKKKYFKFVFIDHVHNFKIYNNLNIKTVKCEKKLKPHKCENIEVNNNYDDIVVHNHLFCTVLIEKYLIEILCHKCIHMF